MALIALISRKWNSLTAKVSGPFLKGRLDNCDLYILVWDLRTNRLLKIVPKLDGVWPRFSPLNSVIMSGVWYSDLDEQEEGDEEQELGSVVNILDTRTYK